MSKTKRSVLRARIRVLERQVANLEADLSANMMLADRASRLLGRVIVTNGLRVVSPQDWYEMTGGRMDRVPAHRQ